MTGKETGWLSLNERRNVAKLKLFHQRVNNTVPYYLPNILPMQRKNIGRYNLRNANDFAEPKCRLRSGHNQHDTCTQLETVYHLKRLSCSFLAHDFVFFPPFLPAEHLHKVSAQCLHDM